MSYNLKIYFSFLTDANYCCILYLLHGVLIPRSYEVKCSSYKKIHIRPSIKDSQNSFILFGNTVEEAESLLLQLTEKNKSIQPFIIVIGNMFDPQTVLVYFDNIRFKFHSVLHAVDVCFKIYHLFDLEYHLASNMVWTFLQKFFYNIHLKTDKSYNMLSILLTELEALMS